MLFIKRAPAIKLIIPFIAGILLQWEFQFPVPLVLVSLLGSLFLLLLTLIMPASRLFRLRAVTAFVTCGMMLGLGSLLTHTNNVRNQKSWFGKIYKPGDAIMIKLDENPIEKEKSFKVTCNIKKIKQERSSGKVSGSVIVYFKKEAKSALLKQGSQVVFTKPLQQIINSGNPGGFNYRRYSLFHGITHQVYLSEKDYTVLPTMDINRFSKFLLRAKQKITGILKKNIPGKKEQGLAEALLIGYKNDLDKSLTQAYSNTGVVHIIAISGLHLGIIYGLLVLLIRPAKKRRHYTWIRAFIILGCLWIFSFMTGGSPSVIRSAVMFSCLILGDVLFRKTSVINTLAFSALLLLCYNPFWIWDVGFQLSYAAVLSIVLFYRPVYNWFCPKNRALDFVWKINTVTIAAQVLTVPFSIYHFHQFPNYFLLANLVAVPLSSLVLISELILCIVSFFLPLASIWGRLVGLFIEIMNTWVNNIDKLPCPVSSGFQVTPIQVILVFITIAGFSFWLTEFTKRGLWAGLTAMLFFAVLRSTSLYKIQNENKIIVYNIPNHSATDLVAGTTFQFIGDTGLADDPYLFNFHLKPTRTLNRLKKTVPLKKGMSGVFTFSGKHILIIDTAKKFTHTAEKKEIDLLIISKSPRLFISDLTGTFTIRQIILDASTPPWKRKYWKRDCDSLKIPIHDVSEKGAFVMRLN